jgi:hypothetical protein
MPGIGWFYSEYEMEMIYLSPVLCGLFFAAQHVAWKRKRPALWFGSLTVSAFFGWVAVGYVAGVGCGV